MAFVLSFASKLYMLNVVMLNVVASVTRALFDTPLKNRKLDSLPTSKVFARPNIYRVRPGPALSVPWTDTLALCSSKYY